MLYFKIVLGNRNGRHKQLIIEELIYCGGFYGSIKHHNAQKIVHDAHFSVHAVRFFGVISFLPIFLSILRGK